MANHSLTRAAKRARDEYYTTPLMVETGCRPYIRYMRGKHLLCPCDDLTHTAFPDWILANWEDIRPASLTAVRHTWEGGLLGGHGTIRTWTGPKESVERELDGDGDFRSPEITRLLGEDTLIVTNPPFSLTREFVPWALRGNAGLLIVNTLNNMLNGPLGPLMLTGRLRCAHARIDRLDFHTPDEYGGDGARIGVARWLTTLPENPLDPPQPLSLTREYRGHENEWRRYDDYPQAIDCPTVADIPKDYMGLMGVPITFLDHMDTREWRLKGILGGADSFSPARGIIDGRRQYKRLLVERTTR